MKRTVLLALLGLAVCLAPAMAIEVHGTNTFVIQLTGAAPSNLAAQISAAGGTLQRVYPEIGYATATSTNPSFASNLGHGNGIQSVDADLSTQWVPSLAAQQAIQSQSTTAAPNPTGAAFYACQWNMRQIDAPGAWAKGQFGAPGVKVAVLDTGVDPFHQDLAGHIDTANSTSMLTAGSSPCGAFDETTIYDLDFHGSFVSGIITSNGIGVAGVAPNAQVVCVKVLNCGGSGSFGDVIAGILYAANLSDVDVINMSLGVGIPKNLHGAGPLIAALNKAGNYAAAQGKLVVVASGNDGADMQHAGNVTWVPAESGNAISIYATGNTDNLASYSNYGISGTWIGAPGGDFPNTQPGIAGCPVSASLQSLVISVCSSFVCGASNFYVVGDGTSFASPTVAGVAALLDGKHGGSLTPADLKTLLKNSADDLGAPGTDSIFIHGRVNASNAVDH